MESIIEFYLGFEHIFKFDSLKGFLTLSEDSFLKFRKNYVTAKEYLTGETDINSLKILRKQKEEGKLSELFDQEVLTETEQKLFKDEQEFGRAR